MGMINVARMQHHGPAKKDDEALLAAVANGSIDALERLHGRYFPKLIRFARQITCDAGAAEEVANDTLLTIWRTAERFEGRSKPSTWIFGIAYRKALKQRQKITRRALHTMLDEQMAGGREDTAEAVIRQTDLANALRQLRPELRAVVELTYFHGLLYSEISEIMSCPLGTVKTRMMTARHRLRRLLSHDLPVDQQRAVA